MARPGSRADRGSYPLDTAQNTPEARTRVKLPPDPYLDDEPRPRRGRRPLILLGAVVALVLVVTIVNRTTHHSAGAQPGAGAQPSSSAGASSSLGTDTGGPIAAPIQSGSLPTTTADNVPVGYLRTAKGAESAATNYVVAFYLPSMIRSSARHRLVDAIADPETAAALKSQLDTAYKQANVGNGLSADGVAPSGMTFVQRCAPIGVSLVSDDGIRATVSIWTVTLSGLVGTGSTHPVIEAWSTETVELHWVHNDWKWVSLTSKDGPVPTSGQQVPSTGQALQNAVNQFGGLRYAR